MGRAASKGVDGAGVVGRAFALRPALLAPATRFRHGAWSCLCPPIQRPSLKHRAVKSSRPPLIDSLPQLSGGERLALAQLQRDDAIAGKPLVVGRRRASGRKRRLMDAIIIEASPFDVDQRRQAFALLAVSLKRDIARLPNGRWEVIVNLGPSDSLKLYGRTRRDTESAIDEFADMIRLTRRQALGVYAYFRSLAARAQQELVVLAAAAVRVGKTALRDAYRADPTLDMHEEARQRILKNTGVDPGRKLTKSVGYLTIYGGGPRRLAQVLSIDYNAAVRFQEQYRYAMPEISNT